MYSLEVFKAMYFAITLTHFWAPGFLNSRSPNFSKLRVSVRPCACAIKIPPMAVLYKLCCYFFHKFVFIRVVMSP